MANLLQRVARVFNGRSPNEKRLTINGEKLPYLEITVPEGKGLPLMVGIHGFGANETQMQTLVNIAPPEPHIYLSLRAFFKHPTGGYAWFPIEIDNGEFQFDHDVMVQTLDKIDAFIQAAVKQYEADPKRIVFVGYSQGGALALSYLLRHPDTVIGSVSTAGNLIESSKQWADPTKLAGKSLFIGYGTLDPFIQQKQMEKARDFFTSLGVDVAFHSYKIPHVVSQSEVTDIDQWLKVKLTNSPTALQN